VGADKKNNDSHLVVRVYFLFAKSQTDERKLIDSLAYSEKKYYFCGFIRKKVQKTLYYVCQILSIREPSSIGDAQGSRGTKIKSIASG
jgi:hypothetical protein